MPVKKIWIEKLQTNEIQVEFYPSNNLQPFPVNDYLEYWRQNRMELCMFQPLKSSDEFSRYCRPF